MDAIEAEKYFIYVARELLHYTDSLQRYGGLTTHHRNIRAEAAVVFPYGLRNTFFLWLSPTRWNGLTYAQQQSVLKHEAIHIRHHRHDRTFRMIAKSIGAAEYSGHHLGYTLKVIGIRQNGTEDLLKETEDYDEARMFARHYFDMLKIKGDKTYKKLIVKND